MPFIKMDFTEDEKKQNEDVKQEIISLLKSKHMTIAQVREVLSGLSWGYDKGIMHSQIYK